MRFQIRPNCSYLRHECDVLNLPHIQGGGADCLLLFVVVRRNKWTKMTASQMIRRSGLAVDVSAPRVVALPLHPLSRGDGRRRLGLPFRVTWPKERRVLAMQIIVRVDRPEFG